MKTNKDLLVSVKYIFKLKTNKSSTYKQKTEEKHTHIIITPIIREKRRERRQNGIRIHHGSMISFLLFLKYAHLLKS